MTSGEYVKLICINFTSPKLCIAAMLALVLALLALYVSIGLPNNCCNSVVVSFALGLIVLLAVTLGKLYSIILRRLNIDPRFCRSLFGNNHDILGVMIYCYITRLFLAYYCLSCFFSYYVCNVACELRASFTIIFYTGVYFGEALLLLYTPFYVCCSYSTSINIDLHKKEIADICAYSGPRIFLLSNPRSGNTWLRYCLEFLTQRPTFSRSGLYYAMQRPLAWSAGFELDMRKAPIEKVHAQHEIMPRNSKLPLLLCKPINLFLLCAILRNNRTL